MSPEIHDSNSSRAPVVIATSDVPVIVHSAGVDIPLLLIPSAVEMLSSDQPTSVEEAISRRIYLMLTNVRGKHDAIVLQAYLRMRNTTDRNRSDQESHLASLSLFGLRRASVAPSLDGMQFILDITAHASVLRRAAVDADGFLLVSIRPRNPLPDGVTVEIDRISVGIERVAA